MDKLQQLKKATRKKYVLNVLSGELGGKEGDYLLSPTQFDEIVTSTYLQAEENCNARYIADLYRLRGHFMMPDLMLEPGKLEIPTNYTILSTMISHLMDKYDVGYEEVKEQLSLKQTKD